jgi:hypothetical protein
VWSNVRRALSRGLTCTLADDRDIDAEASVQQPKAPVGPPPWACAPAPHLAQDLDRPVRPLAFQAAQQQPPKEVQLFQIDVHKLDHLREKGVEPHVILQRPTEELPLLHTNVLETIRRRLEHSLDSGASLAVTRLGGESEIGPLERLGRLPLRDAIHPGLGVLLAILRIGDGTRGGHWRPLGIAAPPEVAVDGQLVAHGVQPRMGEVTERSSVRRTYGGYRDRDGQTSQAVWPR